MATSCRKMAKSCQKWPEIVQYGQKSIEENGQKLSKMAKNCPIWPKIN